MYVVPLLILLALAVIAVAWSPLFALVIAGAGFLVFLAYVGLRPRADQEIEPPTGRGRREDPDEHKGAWGEPRD